MDIDYGLLESWLKEPDAPSETTPTPTSESAEESLSGLAARLRPPFQAALIGWYEGRHPHRALAAIDRIFEQLESATRREQSRRLWWVGFKVKLTQQAVAHPDEKLHPTSLGEL